MREVHQWSCKCFDTSKADFRTPLFAIVLQTIFRQMFKLVDFQLDQYVLWSSFSFSSVTIWSLCALQTSFNQHGSSVILTRTCSNTPNSEFINMNRVYNGCQTHKTHHLQGNPCFYWFAWVFRMMALQFLLVRFGSSWFLPSWRRSWCNGVNMVILCHPHCRRFGFQHFGREWMANAWCLR